ncbi:MAG: aldo/keto reductase [Chloroflexota bacterium]|nr:MAG: aldo/keto reductase [Chloroflexota bacterium]
MEYRQLGASGLRVSEVGLGGNNFGRSCDEAQTAVVIQRALELGVNHIDTADIYSGGVSEQHVGKAIAGRRHEVVLATKVGLPLGKGPNDQGLSYARIIACCEASLRRLGTDYIDVYYLHRPDPLTPLSETLRALDDLVRQGKVRYVGISSYPAWQACDVLWISDRHGYRPPVVTQNGYNLVDRAIEGELLPFCRAHGVGVVPFFPLASGFLTGKYRANEPAPPGSRGATSRLLQQWLTERNFALLAALEGFAGARGHSIGELAIAWLLGHPEVPTVIAGATKPEQVTANVAATAWKLTPEDMRDIEQILATGKPGEG